MQSGSSQDELEQETDPPLAVPPGTRISVDIAVHILVTLGG